MKQFLIFFMAFIANFIASSQNVTITGNIKLEDRNSFENVTVQFVKVSLTAQNATAFTDSIGNYSVSLKKGVYKVNYFKNGFESYSLNNGNDIEYFTGYQNDTVELYKIENNFLSGKLPSILKKDSIYYAKADIYSDSSITIEEGVKIYFGGNYGLTISGKFISKATAENPIFFTSKNKNYGSWKGITFSSSTIMDSLSFVRVEYAQNPIKFHANRFHLTSSTITGFNGIGILQESYSNVENIIISKCKVFNFVDNIPKYHFINSAAIFIGYFTENALINCNEIYDGEGLGIFSNSLSITISGNNFFNINNDNKICNNDYYCGAIWIEKTRTVVNSEQILITNNYFNNANNGLIITITPPGINLKIKNNTFKRIIDRAIYVQNNNGGIITSNAFYKCNIGIEYGYDKPESVSFNNFYENSIDISNFTLTGFGKKIVVNDNQDSVDTYYNHFSNPLFLSETSPLLAANSPNLNAGENGKNIGFSEDDNCIKFNYNNIDTTFNTSIKSIHEKNSNLIFYPNPSDGEYMNVKNFEKSSFPINVYDLNGNKIEIDYNKLEKEQILSLKRGIYILKHGNKIYKLVFI